MNNECNVCGVSTNGYSGTDGRDFGRIVVSGWEKGGCDDGIRLFL
jgi:hypothetical protein